MVDELKQDKNEDEDSLSDAEEKGDKDNAPTLESLAKQLKEMEIALNEKDIKNKKLSENNKDLTIKRKALYEKADNLEKQLRDLGDSKAEEAIKESEEQEKYEEAKKSYLQRISDLESRHAEELSNAQAAVKERDQQMDEMLLSGTIRSMSVELSGDKSWQMEPQIEKRVVVVKEDGERKVVFLDPAGNPSKMSRDEVIAEIRSSDKYENMLIGRGSSGGGVLNGSSSSKKVSNWERYFQPGSINYEKQIELKMSDSTLYNALRSKYPDPRLTDPSQTNQTEYSHLK